MIHLLFICENDYLVKIITEKLESDSLDIDFKIINSLEGIEINQQEFNPHVIYIDIQFKTDSIENLIDKLKKSYQHASIIVYSNNLSYVEGKEYLSLGAYDYIDLQSIDRLSSITNSGFELSKIKSKLEEKSLSLKKAIQQNDLQIEQSSDAIFKCNQIGNFQEVNSAAEKLTGYSKGELLSMKITDLFSKKELIQNPPQLDKIYKGEQVIARRNLIKKNGDLVHVEMNTKVTYKNVYSCIIHDLTHLSKIEQELKKKEERMRTIIEHSSNLFYSHNTEGVFDYISPNTKKFFDCDPDYFIKMSSSFFSNNSINDISKLKTKEAIETGQAQSPFEAELIGKEGRKIWVEIHEEPILKNGKVTGIVGALIDVTEAKKISDKLIKSEKKFRTLFSKAPEGVFLSNEKGIITDCNQAFCKLLECKKEEILNIHVSCLIPKAHHTNFVENFAILKEKGTKEDEMLLLTLNNNEIYTRRIASALYNDQGDYNGAIVHIHDISEHKKYQEELIIREARLSAIFNAADNISFTLSELKTENNPTLIEFSPGAELIFGYKKEEVIGKPSTILYANETKTIIPLFIERLKNGERKIKSNIKMIRKSGEEFLAINTGYPIHDSNGNLTHILGVSIDLTNIIKIENELKTREEQLTTLINASPDIICFKDENNRWVMANDALVKLFDISKIDFVSKTNNEIAELLITNKSDFLKCTSTDELAWTKGESITHEESIPLKNGDIHKFEVIKVPVYHSNGKRKALVTLGRDITIRKQLETQVRHSHKMEAIGLMASGLAHNFNNILQAIVGYIDFAKEGLDITSQRYKDIEQINMHTRRAAKLTKSLLAVGKGQFMNKNEINIVDIIEPIVELTNRNSSNNIYVDCNYDKDIPTLIADGGQIDQVIMNIFINAVDAMPLGGKIDVKVSNIKIDNDFCLSNAWAKIGNYLKISISDTGHGMDEETKRRIFEPYYTTKDMDKGTGLGLSTAFGIITQHKGLINVISKINTGSKFEMFFPIV